MQLEPSARSYHSSLSGGESGLAAARSHHAVASEGIPPPEDGPAGDDPAQFAIFSTPQVIS
jgi:hypothetical protein